MQVSKRSLFDYSFTAQGQTYNFSIAAESELEARGRLLEGLTQIIHELQTKDRTAAA